MLVDFCLPTLPEQYLFQVLSKYENLYPMGTAMKIGRKGKGFDLRKRGESDQRKSKGWAVLFVIELRAGPVTALPCPLSGERPIEASRG